MSISPYTYRDLLYCKKCGKDICDTLFTKYAYAPEDVSNYSSDVSNYPSWDFPKPHHASKADFPRHCGSRQNCLDAIKLSSGRKIGAWLGNELTNKGIEFVLQEIRCKGEWAEMWADLYSFTLSRYVSRYFFRMAMMEKLRNEKEKDSHSDKIHIKALQDENVALRAIEIANDSEILRLRKQQQHLEAEISRLRHAIWRT